MAEFNFNDLYHAMHSHEDEICLPVFTDKRSFGFMDALGEFNFAGLSRPIKGRKADDKMGPRNADAQTIIKTFSKFGLSQFSKIHNQILSKATATRNQQLISNKLYLLMLSLHTYFAGGPETIGKELDKFAVLLCACMAGNDRGLAETMFELPCSTTVELVKEDAFFGSKKMATLFTLALQAKLKVDEVDAVSPTIESMLSMFNPKNTFIAEFILFVMRMLDHASMILVAYWFDMPVSQIEKVTCAVPGSLVEVNRIYKELDAMGYKDNARKENNNFSGMVPSYKLIAEMGTSIDKELGEMKATKKQQLELGAPVTADQMPMENLIQIQEQIAIAIAQRSQDVVKTATVELQSACTVSPAPIKEKIDLLAKVITEKAGELAENPNKAIDLHKLVTTACDSVRLNVATLSTVKTKLAQAFERIDSAEIMAVGSELDSVSKVIMQELDANTTAVSNLQIKPMSIDMVPRADYVAMESLYVEEIATLKHSLEDAEARNQECELKLSEAGRMINEKPDTVERIQIPKPIMRLLSQEQMLMSDIVPTLSDLFPHVVFLEGVEEQTKNSRFARPRQLFGVMMRLCGEYYEALMRGVPDSEAMEILGDVYRANESDSVKNNDKMSRLRMFNLNGTKTFFEQHLTIGSRNGEQYTIQVHFKIVNRVLYIGRIGSHLTTTAKF